MGMAGGIEMHTIAKIIRHYVELIKQTKSYQIALIIQMQLPLVERVAKAIYKGTRTMARGEPVGMPSDRSSPRSSWETKSRKRSRRT